MSEALANVVVGYGIAVLVQMALFPLFGMAATLGQNLAIGLVFTAASIVRSYLLRRVSEAMLINAPEPPPGSAGGKQPTAAIDDLTAGCFFLPYGIARQPPRCSFAGSLARSAHG